MAEYTYEDIIMDPDDPRLEGAIGKECYFSDYPKRVLDKARNNLSEYLSCLTNISKEWTYPFVSKNRSSWAVIIIKKEKSKPKYVPFKNRREFLLYYSSIEHMLTEENHFLSNRGIWLKHRESDDLFMVVEIWDDGVVIGSNQFTTSWNDLSNEYTFLDGSPCRKEVEE